MTNNYALNLAGIAAVALCSLLSMGQQVDVSVNKGDVVLTIPALKPYQLIGREMLPMLTVECTVKGKKTAHLVKFSPGGTLGQENLDAPAVGAHVTLETTINGTKQATVWTQFGDAISFIYFAATDAERTVFMHSMLSSPTFSVEFKPFLTGIPTTAVFDITKLHEEAIKHPECGMQ